MTDILLITEQSIKNITNISDNMAGKLLLTAIRESQEINLREILGDALLDELKRQVAENDVRETYNQLILQCQYFLAYQSCANICMITSVKIDNAGLQRVSDEKMEPLPVSEVNQIHDYYQQKADFYCERLQNFLLQHKEDYPQLSTRQCNSINANLYSSATCGIFLGGPRSKGTQRDCDGMNSSKSQGVEVLDVELTENGTYDYTPKGYGYNKAHIVVNTPEIKNQEKNINITSNGTSTVIPDPEFTGMDSVDITVDVHPSERLVRTYTENGTYPIEGEYNGGEIAVNIGGDVEKYKYLVNKADEDGLRQLGWNDDDINYFKYNNYVSPIADVVLSSDEIQFNLNSCNTIDDFINNMSKITYLPKNLSFNFAITSFQKAHNLKGIPIIDTGSITDFNGLFFQCYNLQTVPLFDTSNGTRFGAGGTYANAGMFPQCYSLLSVPLFDTSNGKIFGCMFQDCYSLKTIPSFNVSNGTDFHNMFSSCFNLNFIPYLDTRNGKYFDHMFFVCRALTTITQLDISNVSTSSDLSYMFYACETLSNITFTGSINTSIDFDSCKNLSYNSIKSILTACSKTTNSNEKTVSFNRTIADQNQELTNLVAQCTEKGWTVSGLTIQ